MGQFSGEGNISSLTCNMRNNQLIES